MRLADSELYKETHNINKVHKKRSKDIRDKAHLYPIYQ